MNAKERLEEYIKEDKIYNDWLDKNASYVSDFDKFCIQHCSDIKEMLKENQELKKQLEYLRSGEYLNQLKFERNLLEDIVATAKVSKEDKEFIDMTHRNTELLEETQVSKQTINELSNKIAKLVEEKVLLRIQISSREEVANDLQQRINKAIHRIQLLQMDNEVTVRDLGLIARDLKGEVNEI